MLEKINAKQTILILRPAFYTLQATVCDEWSEEFSRKAKICDDWARMFERTINKGVEFSEKYREWEKVFLNQSRVCAKQAEMCRIYAEDAKK